MAGASEAHVTVALNVAMALRNQLREYAIIDPERLNLDLFRREGDSKDTSQRWVLHPIEAGGRVE